MSITVFFLIFAYLYLFIMNMHENLNISKGKEMVKAILDKMRLSFKSDSAILNQILGPFKGRLSINFKSYTHC